MKGPEQPETHSSTKASGSGYILALVLVTALLIAPIWTVSVVPWVDYGDHMARIFILAHYDEVDVFQQYYSLNWQLLPNLAVDLVATPMLRWLDPDPVAGIFASLSVLVFVAGCHYFGKAVHGTATWLALPTVFFFYNSLLLYGFVNYIWGVALFLIAAASWLSFQRRPGVCNGAITGLVGFAVYLAHLSGFFFLCCFVLAHLATEVVQQRRIQLSHLWGLIPLAPGLVAYEYLRATHLEGDTSLVKWSPILQKIKHIGVLFTGYSLWMDGIVILGCVAAVALAVIHGRLRMNPGNLLAAVGLFFAFLVFPSEFHTGTDADTRFILPAVLIALLSVSIQIQPRIARIVYGLLLAVFVARIGVMTMYWHQTDQLSQEQRTLLQKMQVGKRLYPLIFLPESRTESKITQHLNHLAGYATIDRHAISSTTFAVPGQQPLLRKSFLNGPVAFLGAHTSDFDWPRIFPTFDYVWTYRAPADITDFLAQNATLVAHAGAGNLYRIAYGDKGRSYPQLNK